MTYKPHLLAAVFFSTLATSAFAAVSAEEAKQLGGASLTVFGAEKAGNKEGTIPAYTGERIKVPASWDPKNPGRLPNPFSDEKPLYSITAKNMDQYADKLAEGQKTLLKRFPNFRMDVYPTHRTVQYPKYLLDYTLKNATACRGVDSNELRIEGCLGGIVFPIPKTGSQVIWNHNTYYQMDTFTRRSKAWLVTTEGKPLMAQAWNLWQQSPFNYPGITKAGDPSTTFYYQLRAEPTAPARLVGVKYIILSALDPINPGQRVWSYIPGQRRIKLAPDISYDTPSISGGGRSTMDENSVFMGPQDRYNMKLLGKKEVFLMYNAYDMNDSKACPEEKLFKYPGYPNPDCVRWELHRAWGVEATLKPGYRHIYPRRVMYFDEDSWGAGWGDEYDPSGALFRHSATMFWPVYTAKEGGNDAGGTIVFDFQAGGWNATTLHNCEECMILQNDKKISETFFSPDAVAGEGVR